MEPTIIDELLDAQKDLELKMNDYQSVAKNEYPQVPNYDYLSFNNNDYFDYYPKRKSNTTVVAKIKIPS